MLTPKQRKEPKVQESIRLSAQLRKDFKVFCDENNISYNHFIETAMENLLKELKKEAVKLYTTGEILSNGVQILESYPPDDAAHQDPHYPKEKEIVYLINNVKNGTYCLISESALTKSLTDFNYLHWRKPIREYKK